MKFPIAPLPGTPWHQILAPASIFVYLVLETAVSSAATTPKIVGDRRFELDRSSSTQLTRFTPQLIAGADNFNPDLTIQPKKEYIPLPSPPPPPPPPQKPEQTAPLAGASAGSGQPAPNSTPTPTPAPSPATTAAAGAPFAVFEGIQPNVYNTWNNTGQTNQTIESTAIFQINNGDRLLFTTGYDTYEQLGTKTATNIPLGLAWETKINSLKIRPEVGVDILSGVNTPNYSFKVEYPLTSGLTVSADLHQGAYKFNAKTIENQVSALRYGPSIFWQIDKDTSLSSSLKLGNYSDNNEEQQSFSRIERKFGEFSVAANLFTWSYKNSTDKGYFAPSDFLVYTGELAWEGSVIRDVINCKLSVSLGGQRVNSGSSDAGGYQTKCTAKISPNVEADLGYSFSNVKSTVPVSSNANTQSILGQLRVKF